MRKRSPEPGELPPSLLDRLKSARSRLIADPKFQRFAAEFPLTRPVARANASAAFDLSAGFVYSQILLACIELDLLNALSGRDLSARQLSEKTGLAPEGMERLLKGAAALKLAEHRSHGRYGLGPQGAGLLANPGVASMIRHHKSFYADLAEPVDLLKTRTGQTNLARYWPYAAGDSGDATGYTALMGATQDFIARDVLDAMPLTRFDSLLDVGGGDGSFLRAAAQIAPDMKLSLFELPSVAKIAREKFSENSVDAVVHEGDMIKDAWPQGASLISLIRILHDHDDDHVVKILKSAREALAPGASLLIAEPTADSAKAGDAYFGFYLWAMGSGRPRRLKDYKVMLRAAGFNKFKTLRTRQPLLARGIVVS